MDAKKTKLAFQAIALTLTYYLTAKWGLGLTAVEDFATLVWAPSGIAVAAVLIGGFRFLPAIFLAAFIVNYEIGGYLPLALCIAVGNTLEAFLAKSLLSRTKGFDPTFPRLRNVFEFIAAAALISPLVSATTGCLSLLAFGHIGLDGLARAWSTWWIGDCSGILLVAPLITVWSSTRISWANPIKAVEACLLFLVAALFSFSVLESNFGQTAYAFMPQPYFLFPLVLWTSIRFRQQGAVSIIFLVSLMTFSLFSSDIAGPSDVAIERSILDLQVFFMFLAVTAMSLAAIVNEKRHAYDYLSRMHTDLESEIQKRTAELRLANTALSTTQKRLAEAQEIAEIGSWEWQIGENKVSWSNELYAIYGLDPKTFDASFEGFMERIHPDDKKHVAETIEKAYASCGAFNFEHRIVCSDNAVKTLLGRGRVIVDEGGRPLRMIGTAQDITERKNTEHSLQLMQEELEFRVRERTTELTQVISALEIEVAERKRVEGELKKAKVDAESANSAKSNFLANMSHEIRTPLGVVLGFSELLTNADHPKEDRLAYAEAIRRNTELLSRIIEDILDLSKVEAGKLKLEASDISLQELVTDIGAFLSPLAADKGLELRIYSEAGLPRYIRSDLTRLKQILINIAGNAIKFTEKGEVAIKIDQDPTKEGRLQFTIRDTGLGISEQQAKLLFEPFVQADNTATRKFGGTGLGLALSRQFARALGGDVLLQSSEVGKGSCFRITVAKELAVSGGERKFPRPETPAATLQSNLLQDVSVLLVEDLPDNQNLIRRFLSSAGAKVDIAENGFEGFQKALAGGYDIVLMDIQMPVMDGYEATECLRREGYAKPILALTAHATLEERSKSLARGCNDHLCKPISRDFLLRKVAQFAFVEGQRVEGRSENPTLVTRLG